MPPELDSRFKEPPVPFSHDDWTLICGAVHLAKQANPLVAKYAQLALIEALGYPYLQYLTQRDISKSKPTHETE